MLTSLTLVLLTATANPAQMQASDASTPLTTQQVLQSGSPEGQWVNSSGQMPGMWDRFFTFSINNNADQRVKDALILTVILNIVLPFGSLWGPMVIIDDAPSINSDILISWLVPTITANLTAVCLVGIPIALCSVPVASLNAYDRAIKARDRKGSANQPSDAPKRLLPVNHRPRLSGAMAY